MRTRTRRAILSVSKSGGKRGGGSTFRATLPTTWVRQMGLGEETRNIKLFFDGEQIIIKNNEEEIKMLEKLLNIADKKIKKEMARDAGFIDDSDDMPERFLDCLAKELVENELVPDKSDIELYYEKEEDIEELSEKLLDMIKEQIMPEYNSYSNDGRYCYYRDKKDLVAWCLTWLPVEAMSLKEEYEWFMDEFGDIEVTLEEYALLTRGIKPEELEDYL
jgi:hypothetical protein